VDVRSLLAEILFMLVMVELVRLLVIYLQEHRVAVDFMVELGIVATLREIVLQGAVELNWEQLVAVSVFLLALGALLRFADLRYAGDSAVDDSFDGAATNRPANPGEIKTGSDRTAPY
jgi:phosphate starvation-inducible membrane PsiE